MANVQDYAGKKPRHMLEFIAVLVIVSILMTLLLDLFFNQQEKITNVAFVGLAQNFTSNVNVMHGQWLMDGQADILVLSKINDNEKQHITVNSSGWVDSHDTYSPCQKIWQQVLIMPLQVVKSPVIALEIKDKTLKKGRLCRYSIANGQFFDYRSDTGRVKQVN